MTALLAYLRRNGVHRGLFGGSRPWMVLGGAAWAIRLLQRAAGHEPQVVYCEELEPGETVVIRHEPASPRKRRRRS